MKDISSNQGAGKANSKPKVKLLQGPIEVRKQVWSPGFSSALFLFLFLILSPVLRRLRPTTPQFGVLYI